MGWGDDDNCMDVLYCCAEGEAVALAAAACIIAAAMLGECIRMSRLIIIEGRRRSNCTYCQYFRSEKSIQRDAARQVNGKPTVEITFAWFKPMCSAIYTNLPRAHIRCESVI